MSLAKNVEFLRRLPKLNGFSGFGDYGAKPSPVRSPLVETTDFGTNPGALRMFSFVPEQRAAPRPRWSSCCTAAARPPPVTISAPAGRRSRSTTALPC